MNKLIASWTLWILLIAGAAHAQSKVTTPREQFGFDIGDDYRLANYSQLVEYWNKLARESQRLALADIGRTAEGRTMLMAVITSPENHKRLARFREISRRLALAEGLSEEEARALAREGRAVVWIDGGLHGTEVLGAQQLIEMAAQMVGRDDAETRRFLDDVILLVACANPDGMELVSDWYMRNPDPARRSTANLPRLYQKYIGHDNNRDFYMSTQPETEAINRVFYHVWFPQIVYNHHQTGPAGTVLFAPPFRDPFNYNFDPLVPVGIDLVAAAMHNRFVAEGKGGATMRSGAGYSTWYNGGLRTTTYFHNMIGILTETIGSPTPIEIPFVPQNQLPRGDLPLPIAPQPWRFRQSVEYAITANRAILDVASKYREELLYNIYRMGRNSIERGQRDTWTARPQMVAAVQAKLASDRSQAERESAGARARRPESGPGVVPLKYWAMLRDAKQRDARGYVIPSDQPDFLTATKFVNALIKNGLAVHRAAAPFEAGGRSYPAGSYVVKSAQAFRPHLLDMFEPQDHPNDLLYPGGPPRRPYDATGWTLAFQMGIRFDRILEGFDGPFEKIDGLAKPPAGRMEEGNNPAGFLFSHGVNDAFRAVNRLVAAGEEVCWLDGSAETDGRDREAGAMFVPARAGTAARLRTLAQEIGLVIAAAPAKPVGEALRLKAVRIGLWDRYGGSMPSGWIRWLLEQFEFPFEVVYAPHLDEGQLSKRYDVLIFPSGAIPAVRTGARPGDGDLRPGEQGLDPAGIPEEYRGRLGSITGSKTIPQLRSFLSEGGTVITIGTSTNLAYHLGLPVVDALTERLADGTDRTLGSEQFYVPGSLLQVRVDNSNPVAYGMGRTADVVFDSSPVFRLTPEAALQGLRPVAWFEGNKCLRSGWALGEGYLDQGVAVVDAPFGKGRIFLFGPEITFRAQPHGTFKFLFNAIYCGKAERTRL